MKQLRINEQPIDFSLEERDTMETIVSHVASWSKKMREYPIKLIIDAQEYPLNHSAWRTIAVADIDTVDIYTFSPAVLRQYLPQLDTIPQLLQSGKKKEAMEAIFKVSTLVGYMITIIPFLEAARSGEVRTQVEALTVDLNNLYDSISNDDTVLTGDLIEYEIRDKLEQLLNITAA